MTTFLENLEEYGNTSTTENGAIGYRTTNSALVDTMYNITNYREADTETIHQAIENIYEEEGIEIATRFLFFARDCRGGLGERRFFKEGIEKLLMLITGADQSEVVMSSLLDLVTEYGRYDDIIPLIATFSKKSPYYYKSSIEALCEQLRLDISSKQPSLLAKWLPSHNKKDRQSRAVIEGIKKELNLSEKQYRKKLSKLRGQLRVVEKDMSSDNWGEIDFSAVPSKAHLTYKSAFARHDTTRYLEFLDSLERGETKINSSLLYPYEIVGKYMGNYWTFKSAPRDVALEEMWKALPALEFDDNILVVRDGSGSMLGRPMEVADSLSILFAENNKGIYHNKLITFSKTPKFINLANRNTLLSKLKHLHQHTEIANTNIEAVLDLVLQSALKDRLPQEEIPTILIISDMEFDSATGSCYQNNLLTKTFDIFKAKFESVGYKLPKIVFWNVEGRTGTIPMKTNELGVTLLSGFSQSIFDMVLNQKTDPREVILDKLNSERYNKVTELYAI